MTKTRAITILSTAIVGLSAICLYPLLSLNRERPRLIAHSEVSPSQIRANSTEDLIRLANRIDSLDTKSGAQAREMIFEALLPDVRSSEEALNIIVTLTNTPSPYHFVQTNIKQQSQVSRKDVETLLDSLSGQPNDGSGWVAEAINYLILRAIPIAVDLDSISSLAGRIRYDDADSSHSFASKAEEMVIKAAILKIEEGDAGLLSFATSLSRAGAVKEFTDSFRRTHGVGDLQEGCILAQVLAKRTRDYERIRAVLIETLRFARTKYDFTRIATCIPHKENLTGNPSYPDDFFRPVEDAIIEGIVPLTKDAEELAAYSAAILSPGLWNRLLLAYSRSRTDIDSEELFELLEASRKGHGHRMLREEVINRIPDARKVSLLTEVYEKGHS